MRRVRSRDVDGLQLPRGGRRGRGGPERDEPSWEPCDNVAENWTKDPRSSDVIECLQARVGFEEVPLGAVVTKMAERAGWN
jgi:hypothetical protein